MCFFFFFFFLVQKCCVLGPLMIDFSVGVGVRER
jgi:hypothetical protein